VLRLLPRKQGETRFDLCREAYTRGERSLAFMRLFAEAAAKQGDDLLALKLLDELCAGSEFDALDIRNAVLLCLALGRTDWALARLEKHRDVTGSEPALQRLELICELSLNGLSERARKLAAEWRARGEKDEFVEGLLKRYGGERHAAACPRRQAVGTRGRVPQGGNRSRRTRGSVSLPHRQKPRQNHRTRPRADEARREGRR